MDALLCFPLDLPAEVTLALQSAGLGHRAVSGPEALGDADGAAPGNGEGWSGAVVVAGDDMTAAVAFCRHLRLREVPLSPLLLVIRAEQVGELLLRDDLFDDGIRRQKRWEKNGAGNRQRKSQSGHFH